jgi:mono/diheme cytochrome c family protein
MQQNNMTSSSSSLSASLFFVGLACLLAALAPVVGPLNAQAAPGGAAQASIRNGDAIFHQRCISCHNKQRDDDSPFGPPNLYKAFHEPGALTPKAAEVIVTNGKATMPSFGAILTKTEIRSVIAYLRSR